MCFHRKHFYLWQIGGYGEPLVDSLLKISKKILRKEELIGLDIILQSLKESKMLLDV